MRVAVSIPDTLFSEAELLVKCLKTTRSDVYARALDAFIDSHAPHRVTQTMNDVLDAVGTAPDAFPGSATRQALHRVEW